MCSYRKKMASFAYVSVMGRCIEMIKTKYQMLHVGDLFDLRGGT